MRGQNVGHVISHGVSMTAVAVLMDDVGAELGKGEISFHRVTFRRNGQNVVLKLKAIRPVAVDHQMGGTAKGAAWGYLIAGPLGAAAGSLLGSGPKVTFELDTEEGETLRCVVGQTQYPGIKRKVEAAARHWERHQTSQALLEARRANGERPVSLLLGTGIVLMPPIFAWFVLRKGTSLRARIVTGAYVAFWLLLIAVNPKPDTPPSPVAIAPVTANAPSDAATADLEKPADARPSGEAKSTSRTMSFEDCNRFIALTADQLGQAPINVVDSAAVRIVRFPANDGSVLVTCSRPDGKMILTQSARK